MEPTETPQPSRASDAITMLIVDDDRPFRDALAAAFTRRGYDVRAAGSADEALALCRTFAPERAVVDLRMPGGSGLELLRALKQADPGTAVVLLTGYGSIPSAVSAMKLGALHYLTKPAEPADIEAAFEGGAGEAGDAARGGEPGAQAARVPSFERASWEYLQRVLAECQGNVSAAARMLGMHRRTLQRKLQKLPPPR